MRTRAVCCQNRRGQPADDGDLRHDFCILHHRPPRHQRHCRQHHGKGRIRRQDSVQFHRRQSSQIHHAKAKPLQRQTIITAFILQNLATHRRHNACRKHRQITQRKRHCPADMAQQKRQPQKQDQHAHFQQHIAAREPINRPRYGIIHRIYRRFFVPGRLDIRHFFRLRRRNNFRRGFFRRQLG